MKKIIYAVLALICISGSSQAAPGDTTIVQAQNNIQLDHYGAYDIGVRFPAASNTFRKVYMIFTLGTYACPAGSQYCHQWDYDVHNVLMTTTGDTLEMSRFITPYATSGVPRFPGTWSHRYVFDISDYYPLLKDTAAFRIFYSGYSWGFTADVKFAFVKGTPERNVIGISKLWSGSYTYGKASDPIDNHVTVVTRTAPAGTQSAELKLLITGHGGDPVTNCCEFASHNYDLKLNGTSVANKAVWRSDCGFNELYPQGGTWIYDRANWCPGSIVDVNIHKLTGVTGGSSYTSDLDFDAYTNTANSNFGSYNLEGNAFYYAAYNKTVDASLESIIAPSDFEAHFRENPSDGKPIIKVRNTGGTAITSMQIVYNVKDSAASSYTWSGSLAPSAETQIQLPELNTLKKMSLASATGTYTFMARVASVNGIVDNDAKNDTLRSNFTVAPTWPNVFTIYMKTNSAGVGGVSESSWKITDASDNIVASRTGADVSKTYLDTVYLPQPGMYKLTVSDGSCDGLNWWVWNQNPQYGITSGSIAVRDYGTGVNIPMRGNTYTGTYHDDFGCGFTQSFSAPGYPAGVKPVNGNSTASLVAYPNPAHNSIQVQLYGISQANGELSIVDMVGKTVLTQHTTAMSNYLNVQALAAGVYNIIYQDAAGKKISSRISITK